MTLTAQLIDTADESHLWSERYDREITDVLLVGVSCSEFFAGTVWNTVGGF